MLMRLLPLLFFMLICMPFAGKAANLESPDGSHYLKYTVNPTNAMGLGSLRTAGLNGMTGEIRIWIIDSWIPAKMLRFVVGAHGKISGESYLYYPVGPKDNLSRLAGYIRQLIRSCEVIGMSGDTEACKIKNIPAQKFIKAYSTIAAAGVWILPSGADVNEDGFGLDGVGMVVELRTGKSYRTYEWSNPEFSNMVEGKLADLIMSTTYKLQSE